MSQEATEKAKSSSYGQRFRSFISPTLPRHYYLLKKQTFKEGPTTTAKLV